MDPKTRWGKPDWALSWSVTGTKRHLSENWKNESRSDCDFCDLLWQKSNVQRKKEVKEAELIHVFALFGLSRIPNPRSRLRVRFLAILGSPLSNSIQLLMNKKKTSMNFAEMFSQEKSSVKRKKYSLIFILFESSLIHTLICGRRKKELIFLFL